MRQAQMTSPRTIESIISDEGTNRNLSLAFDALINEELSLNERYIQMSDHLIRFSNSPYMNSTRQNDESVFRIMVEYAAGLENNNPLRTLLINEIQFNYGEFTKGDETVQFDEIEGTTLTYIRNVPIYPNITMFLYIYCYLPLL